MSRQQPAQAAYGGCAVAGRASWRHNSNNIRRVLPARPHLDAMPSSQPRGLLLVPQADGWPRVASRLSPTYCRYCTQQHGRHGIQVEGGVRRRRRGGGPGSTLPHQLLSPPRPPTHPQSPLLPPSHPHLLHGGLLQANRLQGQLLAHKRALNLHRLPHNLVGLLVRQLLVQDAAATENGWK